MCGQWGRSDVFRSVFMCSVPVNVSVYVPAHLFHLDIGHVSPVMNVLRDEPYL